MKKNRKLCWNCDGSVHIHATKCPYCGSDLAAEQQAAPEPLQPEQAVAPEPQMAEAPPPPYVRHAEPPPPPEPLVFELPHEEATTSAKGGGLLPMLLLLPGAFFLLFSLLLLFFSEDGLLSLEWNASNWWLYATLALPMLYFGWRSLSGVEIAEQE